MNPHASGVRPALLSIALLLGGGPATVEAQTRDFVEVAVSGVRNAPFPTIQGDHRRDFVFATIRRGWTLHGEGPTTLTYIVDVVPVAFSTNNTYRYDTLSCGTQCQFRVPRGRTAFGAGIAPAGLQLGHRVARIATLTAEGTLGAMWFDRNFPDPNARRFNFALGAAAAASVDLGKSSALSVGIVRHHLSNAGTARANPGVNAWMLRVGFVHQRHAA